MNYDNHEHEIVALEGKNVSACCSLCEKITKVAVLDLKARRVPVVQFDPPCPQDVGRISWSTDGSGQGACSGDWTAGVKEDTIIMPANITAGDYVLGWRWVSDRHNVCAILVFLC